MRKAKCTGRFYQVSQTMRQWAYVLIGSILGSTMLATTAGIANPAPSSPAKTAKSSNLGGAMGQSLLKNLLGGEAVRPQTPAATQPSNPGAGQPPATGTPVQLAQGVTFPDIQGHWARSFIEALAARDIIVGFPDGTFRPNDPVTRAQFAAMIRKAFETAAERSGKQFVDVDPSFWGYEAIQEAYRMGFLEGYPNDIFLPGQNIPRVQVLVSLATGLDLPIPDQAIALLNRTYQDAAQIPEFARPKVAAATLNEMVVNYPNIASLNPNQIATRADVAAFIYQSLVKQGVLPPLNPNNVATNYIVGYEPPVAQQPTPPTPPPDQVAALRQQYLLPEPPVREILRRLFGGGTSISTPTAFGAQWGDAFLGFGYQERTRFTDIDDGAVVAGFGLGDATNLVGAEIAVTSYSTIRQGFGDNGGVSFKLHRRFPNVAGGDLAVAFGVENAIDWGNTDAGSSVYGVVTKAFPLRENPDDPFSTVTASIGLGGGRFRSEEEINNKEGDTDLFGSVALKVAPPVNLIAEWTGQDLNLGASIYPIPGVPLVITPAAADVTGNAGDGVRFILGVGYGIQF
ncbi:MAG: S-layer homology domain-containing protein [Cyanobacteriota bacterium]